MYNKRLCILHIWSAYLKNVMFKNILQTYLMLEYRRYMIEIPCRGETTFVYKQRCVVVFKI